MPRTSWIVTSNADVQSVDLRFGVGPVSNVLSSQLQLTIAVTDALLMAPSARLYQLAVIEKAVNATLRGAISPDGAWQQMGDPGAIPLGPHSGNG